MDSSNLPRKMSNNGEVNNPSLQIIKYSPYKPSFMKLSTPSWFYLRAFYVRINKFLVDESTPHCLTLNHIPLSPDTLLEVNGARMGIYSDGVSLLLRRNRVDKKSEEATFVCTNSVRFTGSVKFEVFDKEELVLSGVFEKQPNCNGLTGEGNRDINQWNMDCESNITTASGFLKEKQVVDSEFLLPSMEVYVAGSFLGTPAILTRTLQLSFRKKQNRKGTLNSIPEYETTQSPNAISSEHDLQFKEYRSYKLESEEEYNSMYWTRTEYNLDGEDGELSWFNAGVRVGIGIGLGICLGVGIGVGLLVRSLPCNHQKLQKATCMIFSNIPKTVKLFLLYKRCEVTVSLVILHVFCLFRELR